MELCKTAHVLSFLISLFCTLFSDVSLFVNNISLNEKLTAHSVEKSMVKRNVLGFIHEYQNQGFYLIFILEFGVTFITIV